MITVHIPVLPETRGLFGADQFARMKRGALFINTSRGETTIWMRWLDALGERSSRRRGTRRV